LKFLILLLLVISFGLSPTFAQTEFTLSTSADSYEPGELVAISGVTQSEQIVSIQVKDPTGKTLLVRSITADNSGNYSLEFKIPKTATQGNYIIVASVSIDLVPIIETITVPVQDKIIETASSSTELGSTELGSTEVDDSVCGTGTIMENGKCVVNESEGGGCLIATATYGSEMATEVQQLRELRDNQLMNTESGTAFMGTFNEIYYSFSPVIADYERENPLFKESVKLAITPMISSLSLMDNAESESEVLGLGLSVIMLNIGMYLGLPAVVIVGIRKRI
jgi:hypothetical protein